MPEIVHKPSDLPPIVLAWQIDASTGWGLYGLHLSMQLKKLGRRVYLAMPPNIEQIPKPWLALIPQPNDPIPDPDERVIVVSAIGNTFAPPPALQLPNPAYHVGLTVFEDTGLTAEHVANLKQYDKLIAPSRWCASILDGHGLPDVPVCHQGYDASTFHPASRQRAGIGEPGWDGRVLVFSGGKLEYRKGQDIAIAAFRLFRETEEGKHAVLVTAWHNPWPLTMEGIWNAGHVKGAPKITRGQMELTPWLAANGIPPEAHLDLGQVTQAQAATAIRECDVAIFPNRCEGATNMVLTETLACGVPSVFGRWTGQADLVYGMEIPGFGNPFGMPGSSPFSTPAVKSPARLYRGTDGWRDIGPDFVKAYILEKLHGETGQGVPPIPPSWEAAAPRFNELLTVPELALVP